MTTTAVVAALCAAGAALLLSARVSPPRPPRARPVRSESALVVFRVPIAVLAGAGAWMFLGGVLGVLAGVVAGLWSVRLLGRAESPVRGARAARAAADRPTAVILVAAALRAGADPATALRVVGPALGGPLGAEMAALERRMALGSDPLVAWREAARLPGLAGMAEAVGTALESGAPVVAALESLVAREREVAGLRGLVLARSVEVRSAAPLGVCFLPAFVLLGVVPLAAAVLGAAFPGPEG